MTFGAKRGAVVDAVNQRAQQQHSSSGGGQPRGFGYMHPARMDGMSAL